jgi:hypothetical protein
MNWRMVVTGMGLSILAITSTCIATEQKIKRSDLPPAVEKTVAEQAKGADVRGFSKEVENGKQLYEAELVVNGHHKDISMDTSGKIVEIEEEVSIDSLPPTVREALNALAGKGTITSVESLTKGGKLVAYEAVVKNGTNRSEIQVGPEGQQLKHRE